MVSYWSNFRCLIWVGLPLFNTIVRGDFLYIIRYCTIWSAETRHPSSARCKAYFDILNLQGVSYECDRQTDRRTDLDMTNAAFHYVAWPKIWTADGREDVRALGSLWWLRPCLDSKRSNNIILKSKKCVYTWECITMSLYGDIANLGEVAYKWKHFNEDWKTPFPVRRLMN